MAYPTIPVALTNGTPNDATQVMANFNALLNGTTDGTTDINVAAITGALTATVGNLVVSGNVLGDLTVATHGGTGVQLEGDNGFQDRVRSVAGDLNLESNSGGGATIQITRTNGAVFTGNISPSLNLLANGDLYTYAFSDQTSTCVFSGWVSTVGSVVLFKAIGKTCHMWFSVGGTSNAAATTILPPIYVSAGSGVMSIPVIVSDNGGAKQMGICSIYSVGGKLTFYKDLVSSSFTSSGTKIVSGYVCYQSV